MLMPGIKSFVFDLENLNVYAFSYDPECIPNLQLNFPGSMIEHVTQFSFLG